MQSIPFAEWKRKPVADFFSGLADPFYETTFRVDVTNTYSRAKAEGGSVYFYTMHAVLRAVNSVDAFLYKLRGDTVVKHDFLSPSFTAPARDGLFCIVNVPYLPDEPAFDFARRAKAAVDAADRLFPKESEEARDDLVYLTCLPWLDFTSLTNERSGNRDDSVPRFGWGKLTKAEGRVTMPFSVEVNHRLIDGRHVGALCDALAREL